MPTTASSSLHMLCIAPMMQRTDRHFRRLLRLISRHAYLYTEMVTTQALMHGDAAALLRFHPDEHPLALQLGGDDPDALAECARMAADHGYDEVNLNVGCPSERVQAGRFGACLMLDPARVARCVAAMSRAVDIPVTVKTRLGVDDRDSHELLRAFVARVADAGCGTFIVHARKAWLRGLNPRENREVPPLCHDRVLRLKEEFPYLEIILNGGIITLNQAMQFNHGVDGVMIGRAAYDDPYMLRDVDRTCYGDDRPIPSRGAVVRAMLPYIDTELAAGTPLNAVTRHLLTLYHGVPGARAWRRALSENAHRPGAGVAVVRDALRRVEEAVSPVEVCNGSALPVAGGRR
jgi:tRNA-dihydrouridine synthase A